MIIGTGIDILEISRMGEAIKKWGDSFLTKIFTPLEIKYSSSRRFAPQHFAARFAAKEAVVKAFGEPNKYPIKWTDIEVLNDAEGKPVIKFHATAMRAKKKKCVGDVVVSMSHSKKYAVANAILIKGKR
ncbi:MAG TPA: holo-ACP synthase [Candidatus Omnitrophota bacterium]|nr:holo-ACP synthase [Candidatus Omnitrophota bacterium]